MVENHRRITTHTDASNIRKALAELSKYKELLLMLTYRDIRIRYKQSVMGFMWAIFMPTLIVLAGVLIRYGYSIVTHTTLQKSDIASIAVRSLPWAFCVSAIRFGTNSLISNINLVTKIYFPREVFPLSAVSTALFDFGISSAAVTIVLIFLGIGISVHILWLPVLLLVLVSVITGIAMIVAASALFFRDVKYIVEVLLTFGIFFTPVFFSSTVFGPIGKYMLLNPIAPVLEAVDAVIVLHQAPDPFWLGYSALFGLVMLIFGYKFFKNLEPAFAESI